MIEGLRSPFTVQGHKVFTAASTGIAMHNGSRGLHPADMAMYRARSKDRVRYEVFGAPEMTL